MERDLAFGGHECKFTGDEVDCLKHIVGAYKEDMDARQVLMEIDVVKRRLEELERMIKDKL